MEPLLSICLDHPRRIYHPGDELEAQYQVDATPAGEIVAIEASVLWRTEGKGDEDMAVHHFERIVPADVPDGELRQMFRLCTRLPNSPLSYRGAILKIRWCVRVRAFFRKGRESFAEQTFELVPRGSVQPMVARRTPAAAATPKARVKDAGSLDW